MNRNVLMMLATFAVAALALLTLSILSFDWAYSEVPALGGHLGFLAPILLGFCLFVLGVVFGRADADNTLDLLEEEWKRTYDAYLNGEFDHA